MKQEYADWIAAYVAEHQGHVRGYCVDACMEMKKVFPELEYVPGWIEAGGEHMWLKTPDEEIIDPTRAQFRSDVELKYIPWKPGDEIRGGTCPNCGWDIYIHPRSLADFKVMGGKAPDDRSVCDDECAKEFDAYLKKEMEKEFPPPLSRVEPS